MMNEAAQSVPTDLDDHLDDLPRSVAIGFAIFFGLATVVLTAFTATFDVWWASSTALGGGCMAAGWLRLAFSTSECRFAFQSQIDRSISSGRTAWTIVLAIITANIVPSLVPNGYWGVISLALTVACIGLVGYGKFQARTPA